VKYLPLLAVMLLVGCDNSPPLPTYEQLKSYPVSCKLKDKQLPELVLIQKRKNFAVDPDSLTDEQRLYNASLKDLIWWYSYRCEQ
jgi:hypothetical protein